ncbi:MAG: N-acetyl sugar amidotransferase [Candidatus Omnitrophica bacterium]|nr:N-acetyl sugar amidotransferase [Candidatus Omnitrophota bacterium]
MNVDTRYGKPPFRELRYCTRCCMPETRFDTVFDELGICDACKSHEDKMHINWVEREKDLKKILEEAKAKTPHTYNCIVPISGGKDSTFQLHVLVNVYKMRVLAVTFNHNWYSKVGKMNLENALEKFNVDHIMYTPNRSLVNRLAKQSLHKIGDSCWHCHAGVGSFPLWVAVKFGIPLLIWGESTAEYGGSCYKKPVIKYDRDYFTRISAKLYAEQMVNDEITGQDLVMFKLPSAEEIERAEVFGIHLGDYMFWDGERQTEFVKKVYGWREDEVEGTYKKYKSTECIMPGVHDFSCTIKRGYGRATHHASQDVRSGLMTREEGFEIAKKVDFKVPEKALKYYLEITGMTMEEFIRACKQNRPDNAKKLP